MNIEEWILLNTFWCETLHAKISSKQCKINRKMATKRDFDGYKGPPQCAKCSKWEGVAEVPEDLECNAEEALEVSAIEEGL